MLTQFSLQQFISPGYLQAVMREVTLLQEMVKSLDAFSGQQSRLIVVVDGLDSVEQRKVLSVLDTVHTLSLIHI